jgi:methionine-rich copper-binding protein CopC
MLARTAILAALVACAALFTQARPALGHVSFDHSTPSPGQTLPVAPTQVDVWFSGNLLVAGPNVLNVKNPLGVDIDNNNTTLDGGDHKHIFITLQSNLVSGMYTVDWTATAVDGHTSTGSFTFNVIPAVGGVAELPYVDAPALVLADEQHSSVPAASALFALGLLSGAAIWLGRRQLAPRQVRRKHR